MTTENLNKPTITLNVEGPPHWMPVFRDLLGDALHEVRIPCRCDVEAVIKKLESQLIHSEWSADIQPDAKLKHKAHLAVFRVKERTYLIVQHNHCLVVSDAVKQAQEYADQITESGLLKQQKTRPRFHILNRAFNAIDTTAVELEDRKNLDADDLRLHYGTGFLDWSHKYQQLLSSKDHGLTVLQGLPGTGKTTYVRHLIEQLHQTHRFYVVPVTCHNLLSDPESVDFWLQERIKHKESKFVIVLEDAENLLLQRGPDNQGPLSNLLNLTDGLMGQFIQLHLICTVNTSMERLDTAAMRPGRLLGRWQFERLNPIQAMELAAKKGLSLQPQADYSLAEIYAQVLQQPPEYADRRVGFAA